ncbi:hypothetical protein SAMN07250955_101446 [Arboricoccus pini]|uniref:Uncharacterized protein n=1 Tax=Arboricoccus pini TaxID=1963835 RepID=A0A212Q639_9PROT|nr:hypothetical protein [Arboricoccus pini]SNB54855.1 hypothetical protein SAMN07250955_101446 [Arboricoccus pini]
MIETKSVVGTKPSLVSHAMDKGTLLNWARRTLNPAMVVQLSRNAEGMETLRRMEQASRPFSLAYRIEIAPIAALLRCVEYVLARTDT